MIWYFRLKFFSKLIQTSIRLNNENSFDETTTMTMFQMNTTKMFMQFVIETKNSKTTTTNIKKNENFNENFRNLTINVLFDKCESCFRIIHWLKFFEFEFFAFFVMHDFWLIDSLNFFDILMIVISKNEILNKIILHDVSIIIFNLNYRMIYDYYFYSIIRHWNFTVFYTDTIFENENIDVVIFDDIHV